MLQSSVRLGTIAGIRIGLHYTWFIIFVLMSYSLYLWFMEIHPDWSGRVAVATAVVTSLLFFASILLHELGHSIVAIGRGIRVHSITLFIFGGLAQTEKDADSAATEFWIAIAGPLVSLFLAAVFYFLKLLLGPHSEAVGEATSWLASINLAVTLFNLVPGFPLDGGRVFRALVWGITSNAVKGMNWAVMSGRIVAYSLMAFGLFVMLYTGLLLNGLWMLGIGWFLLTAAELSGQAYTLSRIICGVVAREVMQRDVPWVEGSLSITDWIDAHVLTTGRRGFLVRQDQRVIGLVTLSDCKRLPRTHWPTTPVREVMTPFERLHTVRPEASVDTVLRLMQTYSLNQVPVTEGGDIVGWIDRERLLNILRLHGETGR